jgi:hypothetical protein
MPVILATQVQSQPYLKKAITKRAGGAAQGISPEIKPQCCKKKKKKLH